MRRKTNRKGFTLGEILAVVAIIGILLAVAIPNVLGYARRLKLSELDDDAMAIYMAAQSRLNAMVAAGENISGTLEGHDLVKTSPVSADVTEGGVERQYVSNAVGNAGAPGSTTGNYASLLPSLSVDQELLDHSYVVEYDALTGMVYAVWYWEEDGFDYGEVMHRPEEGDSGYDKNKDMTLLENRSREKLMVGYYGGTDVDRDGVKRMPKFDLTVTNAEELTLKIVTHAATDASMNIKNEDFLVDVSINGVNILTGQNLIPENIGCVVLDTLKSDYKLTTESLTDGTGFTIGASYKGWRQYAQDKGQELPLPGADIVLTVTLRHANNEYLPRVMKVACNSLFAGIDSDRRAMIKYGRHLQNLDSGTSGVNDEKDIDGDSSRITVLTARQIAHIDFKEDKEGSWNKVYGYDRKFTPITNNYLIEYNGSGYMIRYLNAGKDMYNDSGLFGYIFNEKTVYKNIELVNPSAQGYCAGALVGMAGEITIDNCHAYLDAQGKRVAIEENKVSVKGESGDGTMPGAGGLVGYTMGIHIDNSSASLVVRGIYAGGLVGMSMNDQISNCYAAGSVSAIEAEESYAGGLIGNGDGTAVSHSYAAGLISCANANSVGGIAGNATPNISDSYAAVRYTETTGSPTIYGVCQGDPAACYIRQNGVQYAENSGTPATKADITALGLTDNGDWKILTANTSTVAYNLTAQTRRLDVYPYPRLEKEAVHYGDWLEQNNAVLVYFERIGGAYSVYGKLLEDTGEVTWKDLFPTFGTKWEKINELKNSGIVTDDGYGILLPGDGELQPTVMKGEKTVTLQNLNAKVNFQNEEYSLYAFQGDEFDGGDYYQTIKIGDYEYTYNKFFPREVFTEADKPDLKNPAGNVLIRSARHVANMSGHGPSGCNYAQQLDVDFDKYETRGGINGKTEGKPIDRSAALSGAYNGNGHTIQNMFLSGSGLFSTVSGTVSDLTLDTVTVTGTADNVGGLTGSVTPAGTISKVTLNNVTVTGNQNVGGLAGSLKGTATNITLTGLTVESTGTGDVGGLAGTVADKGQVLTAALTGVTVTGSQNAGGLAGTVTGEGKIDTSTLTNVKVTGNQNAGGLVGLLSGGTLESCGVYAQSSSAYAQDVIAYDALTVHGGASSGGLIGQMSGGTVNRSFAAVKVSGGTAGGFVGSATGGTVRDSYSGGRTENGVYTAKTVNVKGDTEAGGFAGTVNDVKFEGVCYSTCSAQATAVGQFAAFGAPVSGVYALGMTFTGDSPVAPADKGLPAPVSGSVTAKAYGMVTTENYPFASPQTEHHGDWPVRKELVYREEPTAGNGPLIVDYYMIEGAGEGTPYAMDGVSGTANGDGWLSWEIHNAEPTENFYRTIYINGYRYYFNPHFADTVQETMPEGAPGVVQINSARQLANISRYTSAGYGKNWTYTQGRDIDYALYTGWSDFKTDTSSDSRQAPIELVGGQYNGGDCYIKNLYLGFGTMSGSNNRNNGGLFGRISGGSTVSNVTLINVSVDVSVGSGETSDCAGALVGRVENSTVSSCGVRVDVTDYTTIESDYTRFGVSAPGTDNVGGLIGAMNDGSSVANSYAAVKVTGKDAVGGFVGYLNGGTVTDCYAGGHTINGVYDKDDANVRGSNAGGFVGKVGKTTTFEGVCYSTCSSEGGAFVGVDNGISGGATLYGAGDAFGATNSSYNTPVPATDKVKETFPYDVTLQGKDYPYKSGHSVHYGDWKNNKITFGVFYRDTCTVDGTGYYIRVWQTRDDGTLEQYSTDSLCRKHHEGTIESPQYGYFCTDGITVTTLEGAPSLLNEAAELIWNIETIPGIDDTALTGLQAYVVSGSGVDSWTFTYSAGSETVGLNYYFGNTISGQKEIRTLQQLKNIDYLLDSDFIQTHDIDASDMNTPIASNNAFTGAYNGGGYQLKDIYISVNGEKAALFATANGGYTIENVILNGGTITADNSGGKARAAGIVADSNDNGGTITNCVVNGVTITAKGSSWLVTDLTTYAGGISANFTGTIKNCEVNAEIMADAHRGQEYAGGIVGELNESKVDHSYSGGKIDGNPSQSGGIVGNNNNGTVSNCYTYMSGAGYAIVGNGGNDRTDCAYLEGLYNPGGTWGLRRTDNGATPISKDNHDWFSSNDFKSGYVYSTGETYEGCIVYFSHLGYVHYGKIPW